jgi:Cu/Ag efflux protein CusF
MLDRLKEGDEILFVAVKVDGAYTVLQFEPVK